MYITSPLVILVYLHTFIDECLYINIPIHCCLMSFKEKNILVVGGSSGIGLDVVQLLTEKESSVYVASRTRAESWSPLVNYQELDVMENRGLPGDFLPEQLHGLVYSVGSINLKPFSRVTEEDLIQDFRLNVTGAAMVIQTSLKALRNAGSASVVLISSVAARTGMGFHTSISASKAAVEGMAVSLAAELAGYGIRVNVVAPSLTDTPIAAKLLGSAEKREAAAKRHPIGRSGVPSDISAAIAFLLSEESSWITGQVLNVDGGLSSLRTNL